MFKHLFQYWYNPTDLPNTESKINIWLFLNIRIFKLKLSKYIYYFILSIKNLKIKKLKINEYNIKFLSYSYLIIYTIILINIILIII